MSRGALPAVAGISARQVLYCCRIRRAAGSGLTLPQVALPSSQSAQQCRLRTRHPRWGRLARAHVIAQASFGLRGRGLRFWRKQDSEDESDEDFSDFEDSEFEDFEYEDSEAEGSEAEDSEAKEEMMEFREHQKQQQKLWEGKYGLPIVTRYLSYEELLAAIRAEKVKQIYYFSTYHIKDRIKLGPEPVEGICLVHYKDESVAQSVIPPMDFRIPLAMEYHGVTQHTIIPSYEETDLKLNDSFRLDKEQEEILLKTAPVIIMAIIWIVIRYIKKFTKSSKLLRRRQEMQAVDEANDRAAREETMRSEAAFAAKVRLDQGASLESVKKDLDRAKVPYEEEDLVQYIAEREERKAKGVSYDMSLRPTEKKEKTKLSEGFLGKIEALEAEAKERKRLLELDRERKRKQQEEAEKIEDPYENAQRMMKLENFGLMEATSPQEEKARMRMRLAARKKKDLKMRHVGARRIFFEDVAGLGSAQLELQEIVDFFLRPYLFYKSGAKIPRGIMLCGPPGTGKTLLARAVAGESGVAFISINASEFVEVYVGVGAGRIRDLFATARSMSPCIVFIDEIDAVGRARGIGSEGNSERDQALNQLLSEMDGFNEKGDRGVVVMGATNRLDVLDAALIRPGRFDRVVYVDKANHEGRIEILKVHLRSKPHVPDLDFEAITRQTHDYSGAMLANLTDSAAVLVALDGRDIITTQDMLNAIEDEQIGKPMKESSSELLRRRFAVKEAGFSLVASLLPAIEAVEYATIVPYDGFPTGRTVLERHRDRVESDVYTKRYLTEQLLLVLAARAAEEVVYGPEEMSSLAARFLDEARRIVQKVVVAAGMSYSPNLLPTPLAEAVAHGTGVEGLVQQVPESLTSEMQAQADWVMDDMLQSSYAKTLQMVTRNRAALDALVEMLLDKSRISGDEVRATVEKYGDARDKEWCKKEERATVGFL